MYLESNGLRKIDIQGIVNLSIKLIIFVFIVQILIGCSNLFFSLILNDPLLSLLLSMLTSCIVIPCFIFKSKNKFEMYFFKDNKVINAVLVFIISLIFFLSTNEKKFDIFILNIIVAISEEFLFRYYILSELLTLKTESYIVVILNVLIFVFIFHSNGGFLGNLVFRSVISTILCLTMLKSKNIITVILLHLLYNLLIILE